ncbi:MAG: hypothetical protein CMP24_07505 [Rickettsiales bacterium]|nr:hypothetical protein [Rickettsiales bacterium]
MSLINVIRIKYFPSALFDYITIFIVNIFFNILFLLFLNNVNLLFKNNSTNDIFMIIPQNIENFAEKKDLIFKRLSLEKNIISVTRIEKTKVLSLLQESLESNNIPLELVPDVLSLEVSNSEGIDLIRINKLINGIIPNAKIYKKPNNKSIISNYFSLMIIVLFLHLLLNLLLIRNSLIAIKKIIYVSQIFGNSRKSIFINLSFGYTFIYLLSSVIGLQLLNMINYNILILLLDNKNNLQPLRYFCYLIFYLLIQQGILYLVFNIHTKKLYN